MNKIHERFKACDVKALAYFDPIGEKSEKKLVQRICKRHGIQVKTTNVPPTAERIRGLTHVFMDYGGMAINIGYDGSHWIDHLEREMNRLIEDNPSVYFVIVSGMMAVGESLNIDAANVIVPNVVFNWRDKAFKAVGIDI